jgi:putative SOS response-associated peptidase YedK
MCGRASLPASADDLEEAFGLDEPLPALVPRYNIAPTQPLLAVRQEPGGRVARPVRWGLVRPSEGRPAKPMINLQAESAAKGALRSLLRDHRCLVPMTGFYEWRRSGKHSQPYNVHRRDGKVFAVAGLFSPKGSGSAEDTCVLLTTRANPVVEPIHARMPLIVDPASYAAWLESSPEEAGGLLRGVGALPEEALEAYPVSPIVNAASADDPRCLAPAKDMSLY